jgi:hypothetical protein
MDRAAAKLAAQINNEEVYSNFGADYSFPANPTDGELVISDEKVMQSAAGFYVGFDCWEYKEDDQLWFGEWSGCFPYSRESEYFATREEAQAYLDYLNQ